MRPTSHRRAFVRASSPLPYPFSTATRPPRGCSILIFAWYVVVNSNRLFFSNSGSGGKAASWSVFALAAAAASSPSLPPSSSSSSYPFDGIGGGLNSDNGNDPRSRRIALVVSTNRNGGYSTAYSFAAKAGSEGERRSQSKNTRRRRSKLLWHSSTSHSSSPSSTLSSPGARIVAGIRSTFLPSGFPASTPDGYLAYVVYSAVQDLSTQLRNVVATQRILRGVGVGKPEATALSAFLQFLMRDGCGMVGSLLFTSFKASQLRYDVKRWRLFADLILDVGMTLEVAALSVPPRLFLPMICAGNVCKAICGVAASACGGAIALHWAGATGGSGDGGDNSLASFSSPSSTSSSSSRRSTDISDIQAKFSAQSTVTGALGLAAAAWFARSVSDLDPIRLWGWYLLLTFIHLRANVACMRLLHFNYLNAERLRHVADDFLSKIPPPPYYSYGGSSPDPPAIGSTAAPPSSPLSSLSSWTSTLAPSSPSLFLPTPREVAEREPLWFLSQGPSSRLRSGMRIEFGVAFERFAGATRWTEDDVKVALASDSTYLVGLAASRNKKNPRDKSVVVALAEGITPLQQTKAYFHALLLRRRIVGSGDMLFSGSGSSSSSLFDWTDRDRLRLLEQAVQREMDDSITWKLFCREATRAGWDLKRSELQSRGYEVAIQYRKT